MALGRPKGHETVRAILAIDGIESKIGRVQRAMTKLSLRMADRRSARSRDYAQDHTSTA